MDVRVEVLFDLPTGEDELGVCAVARKLTNNRASIRVFPREGASDWLVAEFTMENEAQGKAVNKIDCAIKHELDGRQDSIISFPKDRAKSLRV